MYINDERRFQTSFFTSGTYGTDDLRETAAMVEMPVGEEQTFNFFEIDF